MPSENAVKINKEELYNNGGCESTVIKAFDAVVQELEQDLESGACKQLVRSKSCNALYVESEHYHNYENVSEDSFKHYHPKYNTEDDEASEGEGGEGDLSPEHYHPKSNLNSFNQDTNGLQGVKSFDASTLEVQPLEAQPAAGAQHGPMTGHLSVISEGVEPNSAVSSALKSGTSQTPVSAMSKRKSDAIVVTEQKAGTDRVDGKREKSGKDAHRQGSTEALKDILARTNTVEARNSAPRAAPEPLSGLTNLDQIIQNNQQQGGNTPQMQKRLPATPQSVNAGFLGVKGVTVGGVTDANNLGVTTNGQSNALADNLQNIQAQISNLQMVQANLMSAQGAGSGGVGTLGLQGGNAMNSAALNALLSPQQQSAQAVGNNGHGNFATRQMSNTSLGQHGTPAQQSALPILSPEQARASSRVNGSQNVFSPQMGGQQQYNMYGQQQGPMTPNQRAMEMMRGATGHSISNMPTPSHGPMGYARQTPQHGPMGGQHQQQNGTGSMPMSQMGGMGQGSLSQNRKSRQELNQQQMKALYNSIDKTTLPVLSTQQAFAKGEGKGASQSAGASAAVTPRSDGQGQGQYQPQEGNGNAMTMTTPPLSARGGPGAGAEGYVPGTAADPFAQVQKIAESGKMVPQHPPLARPPTTMAPHHRQPQAADEGITFLEERKRYFSRQKQQAVFHYTLRHAKQYAKVIGMTIEWCFAHLEEKRKIDLANGIKNPIAELAQRTDLDEYTRKAEKARLEIIKKADEIDFLLRQKALESAMGMSSGTSGGNGGLTSADGGIVSHSGAMASSSGIAHNAVSHSAASAAPHSAASTAFGGRGAGLPPGFTPTSGNQMASMHSLAGAHHSHGYGGVGSGVDLPTSGQMQGVGYSYAETLPSMDQPYYPVGAVAGGRDQWTGVQYM